MVCIELQKKEDSFIQTEVIAQSIDRIGPMSYGLRSVDFVFIFPFTLKKGELVAKGE